MSEESTFAIPRGETRRRLAESGFMGKISFTSEWSEMQLQQEISAIFSPAFGLSESQTLPFKYLSTIKGSKKLMTPNVTSNFRWGGKEVASICSNSCLYIMAGIQKSTQDECFQLSDDSDFESPVQQRRRVTQTEALRESQDRHQEAEASTQEGTSERQTARLEILESRYHFADFIPVDVDEDEAVDEAIRLSLLEDAVDPSHCIGFREILTKDEAMGILRAHSDKVVNERTRPIHISRSNVWTTAFRQFSRPKFAESSDTLYVTFASDEDMVEDAVDYGGPRREFFRLLVKAIIQDSGAFEETPNGFTLKLNISHVQSGVYRTIGRMMSTMIVQGGEPPAFLSPHVVDYIVTGDILQAQATINDVSDHELREDLNKVKQANTEGELEEAVSFCDTWRFQVGGLPVPVTMDNRDTFIKNAALYHVILQRQSCLDQLIDGMSYYGVLPLLREKPGLRTLLDMPEEGKEVTADMVARVLKPTYSILGSNKRPREELMVVKFREFLQCVQNKELSERLETRTLTKEEAGFVQTLSPGHILAYATGSSQVPAVGFHPNPKILFTHDDTRHHPIAHTCGNALEIFVNSKNLADNDEFDYHFIVALMNGALFSSV